MTICICATDRTAESVVYLEKLMEDILPGVGTCIYHNIKDFEERLRDPRQVTDIVVLAPADEQELDEYAELGGLFDDTKVLLVLHECSSKMVLRGHILRPRFMIFADTEPKIVGSVLEKLAELKGDSSCRKTQVSLGQCPSDAIKSRMDA